MKFKSQFDSHDRVFSCPGSPIKILYAMECDKNGIMDLVEKGKENLYDYIQSHAESVDINVILKRYANGDINALNVRDGFYGDISDMPTNMADIFNIMLRGEEYFNGLSPEVRANFNNSFSQFATSIGSSDFLTKLGIKPVQENAQLDNVVETVDNNVDVPV